MLFQQRTVFITGASRGIGKAIALRLASQGANIVIAAKSVTEDPRLGGTIYSAAEEVVAAGGQALAVQVDIRDEAQIQQAVQQAAEKFGGIDIIINNASAIQLTNTEETPAKRFDLMFDINVRGTFLVTQHCIPYLKKGTQVYAEGTPEVRTYPKNDGTTGVSLTLRVQTVQLLGSRGSEGGGGGYSGGSSEGGYASQGAAPSRVAPGDITEPIDDLPF